VPHRPTALQGALVHVASSWLDFVRVPLVVPLLRVDATELLFFGSHGVTLFFLLSGYLLTWTEEKRARSGTYSVRSYFLRRALRLVPAYYAAILIAVVLWPNDSDTRAVLLHVSFLHAFDPVYVNTLEFVWWSLTPEVIFYCLLPFIVLKLPRTSSRLALFGVFALITLIIRLSLYESLKAYAGDPLALATWKPSVLANTAYYATQFLYIFLAGVLLRTLVEYLNGRPASRLRLRLATALFLVSAASMVVLLCLGMKQTSIFLLQGNPLGVLMGTPVDLLVIAFFASAVLGSPLLGAVLKWRFLAFTGMISYSLFLLHNMVIRLLTHSYYSSSSVLPKAALPDLSTAVRDWVVGQGSFAVWVAFSGYTLVILVVSFPLSYLSYRFIERPFLSSKPK
jgi:peptidoglycan/LPS O-acetylase OafA/YrhL